MERLKFYNLPFEPDEGKLVYIEHIYNNVANEFIADNINFIRRLFAEACMEFVYVPVDCHGMKTSDAEKVLHECLHPLYSYKVLVPCLLRYVDDEGVGETFECYELDCRSVYTVRKSMLEVFSMLPSRIDAMNEDCDMSLNKLDKL